METPSSRPHSKLRKDGKPYVYKTDVDKMQLKKQVKKWIMQGKSWRETIENMMNTYGYTEESACNIYTQVNKEVKEYMEKHKNDILDVQMQRLEQVIEDTFEAKDYKNLLKATDQLSKLAQLYETKVKVEAENFNIKIGE